MSKRFVRPDKEELKKDFAAYKQDFLVAVKDKKRWIGCLIELLIMGVCLAVDLITKHFIYGYCKTVKDIVIIKGVIRFTAVENTGASFGILKNSTLLLTIISLISAIILVLFMFYSYPRRNKWLRSALILISAGAIGNVVDRFAFGYVRDFVYFELIDFAVFNLADSCLTVGVVVLIIYILFYYGKEEEELRKAREAAAEAAKIDALVAEAENESEPESAAEAVTEPEEELKSAESEVTEPTEEEVSVESEATEPVTETDDAADTAHGSTADGEENGNS